MSRLVNLSDTIYMQLTRIKKAKRASYSEVVAGLLKEVEPQKTHGWEETLAKLDAEAAKFKGKKEKTDYDLIAYGVSRDNP